MYDQFYSYIMSFNDQLWDISILNMSRETPTKLPVDTVLLSDSIIFQLKYFLSYIIIFDYLNSLEYDIVHIFKWHLSPYFPTKSQGTCGEFVSHWTDISKFITCQMLNLEFVVSYRGSK